MLATQKQNTQKTARLGEFNTIDRIYAYGRKAENSKRITEGDEIAAFVDEYSELQFEYFEDLGIWSHASTDSNSVHTTIVLRGSL
jgi:hypothetical protein